MKIKGTNFGILTASTILSHRRSRSKLISDNIVELYFRYDSSIPRVRTIAVRRIGIGAIATGSFIRTTFTTFSFILSISTVSGIWHIVVYVNNGRDVSSTRTSFFSAFTVVAVVSCLDRFRISLDQTLATVRVTVPDASGIGTIQLETLVQTALGTSCCANFEVSMLITIFANNPFSPFFLYSLNQKKYLPSRCCLFSLVKHLI